MPRPTYPPYGFSCPYTDRCPHLDGLSTTWVFEEYQRADEAYHEHLRIVEVLDARLDAALKQLQLLKKENAELKAKNTASIADNSRQTKRRLQANRRGAAQGRSEALLVAIPDGRDLSLRMWTEPFIFPPLRYVPIADPIAFCPRERSASISRKISSFVPARSLPGMYTKKHTVRVAAGLWCTRERMSFSMPLSGRLRSLPPSIYGIG